MPELTRAAALTEAIERQTGERSPQLLRILETNPRLGRLLMQSGDPHAWVSELSGELSETPVSNNVTLGKALRSAATWLATRQEQATEEVVRIRMNACDECPHKTEAPASRLYHLGQRIMRADGNDICGACGCFISVKAKLAKEDCPVLSSIDNSKSRWAIAVEGVQNTE